MTLERLWAGWRAQYIEDPAGRDGGCVFCRILASGEPDEATYVVWRSDRAAALLNAYPYVSGHVMVMPVRHVAEIEDLDTGEARALWSAVGDAVRAVKAAYSPDGLNVGANLGEGAGAGLPGHLHVHCLPRWRGDTNFMTAVAETRVLPEALPATWSRLRGAWPAPPGGGEAAG